MQAKLIQQLNAKRAEDGSAQIAALQEENAQLKEENEKMRSKLNAAAVSYTAVRAAMREENQVRKEFITICMSSYPCDCRHLVLPDASRFPDFLEKKKFRSC